MDDSSYSRLLERLRIARELGFFGPGPVDGQLAHAYGFAATVARHLSAGAAPAGMHLPDGSEHHGASGRLTPSAGAADRPPCDACSARPIPKRGLDLGSGGGLPGLLLALLFEHTEWTFLDAHRRRCDVLIDAIMALGIDGRCRVEHGRAEPLARLERLRGRFDLVVARGFGGPAVTAECAAGFLQTGGLLVVSEPPNSLGDRWDAAGLDLLGMRHHETTDGAPAFAVLVAAVGCGVRFPRADGVPGRKPLWRERQRG